MSELTLRQSQQIVDQWIQKYGVRYFNELTNLGILMEEVGEVARLMTRLYGEQSFKPTDKDKSLAEELGDVFFVLICLANQCGIDLTEAFNKNMEKKTRRDHARHLENEKLRPE